MRYTVSLDLTLPVLIEVEAKSEEDAEDVAQSTPIKMLIALANTERDAVLINVDGVSPHEE